MNFKHVEEVLMMPLQEVANGIKEQKRISPRWQKLYIILMCKRAVMQYYHSHRLIVHMEGRLQNHCHCNADGLKNSISNLM